MFIKIIKGILLWINIISMVIFLMGVEIVVLYPVMGMCWIILNIILTYCSANIISFQEFCQLTGYNWINNNLHKLNN